ncbi:MAG: hypothetical protein Q9192_007736 [Flavoplaca navasiana]
MNKKRAEEGPGLTKILKFCKLALEKRYTWVWVDTCCIDKKSSAELSEAINSMFKWYQSAEECVVYLSDVSLGDQEVNNQDFQDSFSASSWFTRGWTLQELLAPRKSIFYDTDWNEIGSKHLLCGLISATTGIKKPFIAQDPMPPLSLHWANTAQRMSWVAKRKTSRSEDLTYCLLGLFDVNMPLLYGEGAEKAFLRLQMEILSKTEDDTVFAWTADVPRAGILATDPSYFADAGAIESVPIHDGSGDRQRVNSKGLALQILTCEWPAYASPEVGTVVSIPLYISSNGHLDMGIQIQLQNSRNIWCRINCQSLVRVPQRNHFHSPLKRRNMFHVIYMPLSLVGIVRPTSNTIFG